MKEEYGKATNNPGTQVSGIADQVKGQVKQAVGNFKEEANKNDRKDDRP